MTAGDGKVAVPGKSPAVGPSLWSKDGTDGLGAIPSVLEKSRTAHHPRPSDGTVDITGSPPQQPPISPLILSQIGQPLAQRSSTICRWIPRYYWHSTGTGYGSMGGSVSTTPSSGPPTGGPQQNPKPTQWYYEIHLHIVNLLYARGCSIWPRIGGLMGVIGRGGGEGGLPTQLDFSTNACWNSVLSLPVSLRHIRRPSRASLASFKYCEMSLERKFPELYDTRGSPRCANSKLYLSQQPPSQICQDWDQSTAIMPYMLWYYY